MVRQIVLVSHVPQIIYLGEGKVFRLSYCQYAFSFGVIEKLAMLI